MSLIGCAMTDKLKLIDRIAAVIGNHIPIEVDSISGCDCGEECRGWDWNRHLAAAIMEALGPSVMSRYVTKWEYADE